MFLKRDLPTETIASAYRLILARPMREEDLAGLDPECRRSLTALQQVLLHSEEFRRRVAPPDQTALLGTVIQHYFGTQEVETRVEDPEVLEQLMARTIGQWQAHGAKDPVWSITTDDTYRADVMTGEKLEQFYASGQDGVAVIQAFEQRTGARLRGGTCLELGAGVGRVTEHLAAIFDRVIAVEISDGILDLCRERMAAKKITNVECRMLAHPADLERFAPFDLFFSTAVMQHNTPPIQRRLLEHAIAGLSAGGHCLFQTPDRLHDYWFSARHYLQTAVSPHDLHCFPRARVIEVLNAHGMTILDVAPDGFSTEFGSFTYLARKGP